MYTETKKKSIAFIYIFVLTQNLGEMDSIYLFNLCTKKEYFSYRVFLLIVVDTESWRDG